MLTLYIGNKNYSSWSMRPWVLMRQMGIAFTEHKERFDSFDAQSQFKHALLALNPQGKVPVLIDEGWVIWDSLAIAEYLAEKYPQLPLWPTHLRRRAHARSLCADIHSGYSALRQHCGMNIEAELNDVGKILWTQKADLRADVQRLCQALSKPLLQQAHPNMLMGDFGIVDAFYAPVCSRIRTYGLPVTDMVQSYVDRVLKLPAVQQWCEDARHERDFLPFEEPYRTPPSWP
ncbi:MAG: glutathione S-transferase family protein [Betaproteobacteria bacterium]|nr:glutathione S-transferase family protein [Betaproteobacteria bacterium]NBY04927.1 glutathione S-transferase family protein [Betaproteobacteria bacterium]